MAQASKIHASEESVRSAQQASISSESEYMKTHITTTHSSLSKAGGLLAIASETTTMKTVSTSSHAPVSSISKTSHGAGNSLTPVAGSLFGLIGFLFALSI